MKFLKKSTIRSLILGTIYVLALQPIFSDENSLIDSIKKNNFSLVQKLAANNKLLNKPDSKGFTALMHGVALGNVKVVRLLLERKANPNIEAKDGVTSLALAIIRSGSKTKKIKKGEFSLEYFKNKEEAGGQMAIDAKKAKSDILRFYKILSLLLKHNAEVNYKNKKGLTALFYAIMSANRDHVDYLLAHKASVHVKNKKGQSPLLWAVAGGYQEITERLIKHGADLDYIAEKDKKRPYSALMLAASLGKRDMVELLIDRGANIKLANSKDDTAKSIAKASNNSKIISLLTPKSKKVHKKKKHKKKKRKKRKRRKKKRRKKRR